MLKQSAIGLRTLLGSAVLAAVVCLPARAAALNAQATRQDGAGSIYVAQAMMAPDDAVTKAMHLLNRPDGAIPSRADVDTAGHMLIEAGPDAFAKAMNLLQRPGVTSTQIEGAKMQLMKGGPDATTQAMNLLRKSYGY